LHIVAEPFAVLVAVVGEPFAGLGAAVAGSFVGLANFVVGSFVGLAAVGLLAGIEVVDFLGLGLVVESVAESVVVIQLVLMAVIAHVGLLVAADLMVQIVLVGLVGSGYVEIVLYLPGYIAENIVLVGLIVDLIGIAGVSRLIVDTAAN